MPIAWMPSVAASLDCSSIGVLREIGGELYAMGINKSKLLKLVAGVWQSLTASNDLGGTPYSQGLFYSAEIGKIICSAESSIAPYDPLAGDWEFSIFPSTGFKGELFDKPSSGKVFFGGWAPNDRYLHSYDGTIIGVTTLGSQLPIGEYIRANAVHNSTLFCGTVLGSLYEYDGAFSLTQVVVNIGEEIRGMLDFDGSLYCITNTGKLYRYDEISAWIMVATAHGGQADLRAMVVHDGNIYASSSTAWVLKWNGVDAWETIAGETELFSIDSLVSFDGKFYGASSASSELLELQLEPVPPVPDGELSTDISLVGHVLYEAIIRSSLVSTFGWLLWGELSPIVITDYCTRNKERIIEQFEDKPLLLGLLCSLVSGLQELEFTFDDLYSDRWISIAIGAQLDGLGEIIGVTRQGLDDNEYRAVLRFQILINLSNGEWETVIAVAKALTGATVAKVKETFPAGVDVFTDGSNIPVNIVQLLEQAAPAGVRIGFTSSHGEEYQFAYEIETATLDPKGLGYSEPGEAGSGGAYVERIL